MDAFSQGAEGPETIAFISSMGCSDPNCTDAAHYHNCPADCADYNHYHSCPLDCTEAQHHHTAFHHDDYQQTGSAAVETVTFISSMGCSDPNCTDAAHYHSCPADCADYNHYHSCPLDCTEAQHHHTELHHDDHQQTGSAPAESITFISSMGCSDPNCTNAAHYHSCPADCADYSHYHNCSLDCTEASHHHASRHHGSGHH